MIFEMVKVRVEAWKLDGSLRDVGVVKSVVCWDAAVVGVYGVDQCRRLGRGWEICWTPRYVSPSSNKWSLCRLYVDFLPSTCISAAIILHSLHAPCQGIICLLWDTRLNTDFSCTSYASLCQTTATRPCGEIGTVTSSTLWDMEGRWTLLRGGAAG